MKIAKALQNISTLTKFYINDNDITDEAADDIATVISCNNIQLQEFDHGGNHLQVNRHYEDCKKLYRIFLH